MSAFNESIQKLTEPDTDFLRANLARIYDYLRSLKYGNAFSEDIPPESGFPVHNFTAIEIISWWGEDASQIRSNIYDEIGVDVYQVTVALCDYFSGANYVREALLDYQIPFIELLKYSRIDPLAASMMLKNLIYKRVDIEHNLKQGIESLLLRKYYLPSHLLVVLTAYVWYRTMSPEVTAVISLVWNDFPVIYRNSNDRKHCLSDAAARLKYFQVAEQEWKETKDKLVERMLGFHEGAAKLYNNLRGRQKAVKAKEIALIADLMQSHIDDTYADHLEQVKELLSQQEYKELESKLGQITVEELPFDRRKVIIPPIVEEEHPLGSFVDLRRKKKKKRKRRERVVEQMLEEQIEMNEEEVAESQYQEQIENEEHMNRCDDESMESYPDVPTNRYNAAPAPYCDLEETLDMVCMSIGEQFNEVGRREDRYDDLVDEDEFDRHCEALEEYNRQHGGRYDEYFTGPSNTRNEQEQEATFSQPNERESAELQDNVDRPETIPQSSSISVKPEPLEEYDGTIKKETIEETAIVKDEVEMGVYQVEASNQMDTSLEMETLTEGGIYPMLLSRSETFLRLEQSGFPVHFFTAERKIKTGTIEKFDGIQASILADDNGRLHKNVPVENIAISARLDYYAPKKQHFIFPTGALVITQCIKRMEDDPFVDGSWTKGIIASRTVDGVYLIFLDNGLSMYVTDNNRIRVLALQGYDESGNFSKEISVQGFMFDCPERWATYRRFVAHYFNTNGKCVMIRLDSYDEENEQKNFELDFCYQIYGSERTQDKGYVIEVDDELICIRVSITPNRPCRGRYCYQSRCHKDTWVHKGDFSCFTSLPQPEEYEA